MLSKLPTVKSPQGWNRSQASKTDLSSVCRSGLDEDRCVHARVELRVMFNGQVLSRAISVLSSDAEDVVFAVAGR